MNQLRAVWHEPACHDHNCIASDFHNEGASFLSLNSTSFIRLQDDEFLKSFEVWWDSKRICAATDVPGEYGTGQQLHCLATSSAWLVIAANAIQINNLMEDHEDWRQSGLSLYFGILHSLFPSVIQNFPNDSKFPATIRPWSVQYSLLSRKYIWFSHSFTSLQSVVE